MWCLECFWEHQGRVVLRKIRVYNQIFQDWVFLLYRHDKLLQIMNREGKAEVADAMTLLESKQYRLFIFCSDAIFTVVINGERKGR
jgi:hypothetical protein